MYVVYPAGNYNVDVNEVSDTFVLK